MYVYLFGDALQLLEEFRRGVDVTTFGLDGLDHNTGHKLAGLVVNFELLFHLSQAPAILGFIFFNVIFKGILVTRETGDGPIQRWEIQFKNGSGMRRRKATKCLAVKTSYWSTRIHQSFYSYDVYGWNIKAYIGLPLNDMMVNGVEPGARFTRQLLFSSSLMDAPPRCLFRYHMNAALKAFSLEQEPHAIVFTLFDWIHSFKKALEWNWF